MGAVYAGRLRGDDAGPVVAIKRAHRHLLGSASFRDVVVREATLSARVSHTNVVPALDVEDTGGELLIVMQYVEGATLSELFEDDAAQSRALPIGVALRIAADAAEGLAAVHELADDRGRPLGLAHGDVSPDNVLVGTDGVARLIDFGLARTVGGKSAGASGALAGTLAYLAPERVRGAPAAQRADVFSMAAVAWETITGRRLFAGRNQLETMANVTGASPAPAPSSHAAADADLDRLFAGALEKDEAARTTTAADLARGLAAFSARAAAHAAHDDVSRFVDSVLGPRLVERRALLDAARRQGR
jgi:serine/threonine-protein kinase